MSPQSSRNTLLFFRRNQRGSSLLPTLILSAVMAVTTTSLMIGTQSRMRAQSHMQAREDAGNLEVSLRMVLTSHDACKANLNSSSFGSTFEELKNLSASKTIKAMHRTPSGASDWLAVTSKSIGRAKITGMAFNHITQLDTTTSYLADLKVELVDAYGVALKPLSIPFYFTTDLSGTVTDCIATSYPSGAPTFTDEGAALVAGSLPRTTMEDILCEQSKGANNYYSPTTAACVNTTMIGTN